MILRYEAGKLVLEDTASNERRKTTESQLVEALGLGVVLAEDGSAEPYGVLTPANVTKLRARGVTDRALEVADAKLRWINELRHAGITRLKDEPWVRTHVARLAQGALKGVESFSITTLYETDLAIRKANGDVCVAVPDYANRGGVGGFRGDERALKVLHARIVEELEARPPRPIVARDIWSDTNVQIGELNLAMPEKPIPAFSETTVRRIVKKTVPADVMAGRKYGIDKAKELYRVNSAPRDTARRPLEIAEYDDIDAAVFLVDESSGMPWGRAYITNGIDQNTASNLGYDIGDAPRSFNSAMRAICDSLLPKADCAPGEMGYGAQGMMLLDNARYNHGRAMKHQSKAMNLLLSAARPYGPTEKATIENYNGTVKSDFCPTLPGWRGEKNDRDAVQHGMSTAILTFGHFARLYRHWVTKIYANDPGDDGFTPKQRWLRVYDRRGPAIRYSREQLAFFRLRPVPLTFRASGGLLWHKLPYDSEELEDLRRKLGHEAKVMAYVDSEDMHYIYVLDPYTRDFVRAFCLEDEDYLRNLTEAQQKLILQIQRSRGIKNPSRAQMKEGRDLLKQMVAEAMRSSKMRTRNWARRKGGAPSESPNSADAGAAAPQSAANDSIIVTDLEYEIRELQEIELVEEDLW